MGLAHLASIRANVHLPCMMRIAIISFIWESCDERPSLVSVTDVVIVDGVITHSSTCVMGMQL